MSSRRSRRENRYAASFGYGPPDQATIFPPIMNSPVNFMNAYVPSVHILPPSSHPCISTDPIFLSTLIYKQNFYITYLESQLAQASQFSQHLLNTSAQSQTSSQDTFNNTLPLNDGFPNEYISSHLDSISPDQKICSTSPTVLLSCPPLCSIERIAHLKLVQLPGVTICGDSVENMQTITANQLFEQKQKHQDQINTLSQQIQELKNGLQYQTYCCDQLQRTYDTVLLEHMSLKDSYDRANSSYSNLTTQLEKSQAHATCLLNELKLFETNSLTKVEHDKVLSNALDSLRAQHNQSSVRITKELKKEHAKLIRLRNDQCKKQENLFQSEKEVFISECKKMKEENVRLMTKCAALEKKSEAETLISHMYNTRSVEILDEKKVLEKEILELKTKLTQLNREVSSHHRERLLLKAQIQYLEPFSPNLLLVQSWSHRLASENTISSIVPSFFPNDCFSIPTLALNVIGSTSPIPSVPSDHPPIHCSSSSPVPSINPVVSSSPLLDPVLSTLDTMDFKASVASFILTRTLGLSYLKSILQHSVSFISPSLVATQYEPFTDTDSKDSKDLLTYANCMKRQNKILEKRCTEDSVKLIKLVTLFTKCVYLQQFRILLLINKFFKCPCQSAVNNSSSSLQLLNMMEKMFEMCRLPCQDKSDKSTPLDMIESVFDPPRTEFEGRLPITLT